MKKKLGKKAYLPKEYLSVILFFLLIIAAFKAGTAYYKLQSSPKKTIVSVKSSSIYSDPRMIRLPTISASSINLTPPPPKKAKLSKSPTTWTLSAPEKPDTPFLYKAIIAAEDVLPGDKQSMSVYVKDDKHSIKTVVAEVQTDKEKLTYPFALQSGDLKDGVWHGSWIVKDTHETTYVTKFIAMNDIGKTREARISWTDAGCGCSTTAGAACTISTTCTVSGVEGAGGSMTITGSVTVPSGTALVFSNLTVSGTVNAAGQIGTGTCGNFGSCSGAPCNWGTYTRTCTWAAGGTVSESASCYGGGTWYPSPGCGAGYCSPSNLVCEGWCCDCDPDCGGGCQGAYCHCPPGDCHSWTNWGCCY